MKLQKVQKLPASLCDAEVRLSVVGAFQIVEDMVTELMGAMKIDGVTCMREYGAMWVFVRNRIEFLQPIAWMEEYTAESYISSFSNVKLLIDTVLKKQNGTIALASRLELCAVDLETQKIRKSSTVGLGETTPAEKSEIDIVFSREKYHPAELLEEICSRSSDIDYCHHTNNISYIRYLLNQISVKDLMEHTIKTIEVQYVNQTHEGDKLAVYRCEGEGLFTIQHDGRPAVNCIITRE